MKNLIMTLQDTIRLNLDTKTNDNPLSERIDYLLGTNGSTKAWLADRLGISRQALNYILKHKKNVNFISEIAEIFNVNPDWLKSGTGSMITYPSIDLDPIISINVYSIDDLKREKFLDKINACTVITSHDTVDKTAFGIQFLDHLAVPFDSDEQYKNIILIFNHSINVEENDPVLARIINDNLVEIVFGNFIRINNKSIIHSADIDYTGSIEILGVLKEKRYRF